MSTYNFMFDPLRQVSISYVRNNTPNAAESWKSRLRNWREPICKEKTNGHHWPS